jgi:hypothetical protein
MAKNQLGKNYIVGYNIKIQFGSVIVNLDNLVSKNPNQNTQNIQRLCQKY